MSEASRERPVAESASVAAQMARGSRLRRVIDSFAAPSAGTLFFLGFGCGLPFFLVGQTLTIWLRDVGIVLGIIGLVSYANFFYVLKFLWAPLLDWRPAPLFGRLGRRRGWLLLSQLALVAALIATALVGPGHSLLVFTALIGLIALAGATQDSVVDAYRIEVAPVEAQGALVATYSLGYRLGLIAGGAGALYLAQFGGWRVAYLTMAALLVFPIAAVFLAREPDLDDEAQRAGRRSIAAAYIDPFKSFFRSRRWIVALVLLVFVGLYKMPDQMLGVIAGPFYLDIGFSKADVATVSKLFGVWVGLAGVVAAGAAIAVAGIRPLLLIAALGVALSNLLYILMALHPGEYWAFVLTISGDNFALGFAGTVLVAYMSTLTTAGYTATQYALLSSLANLPGKVIGGLSGFMVEAWGYTAFFVFSALSLAPTLILLAWLWRRVEPVEPRKV